MRAAAGRRLGKSWTRKLKLVNGVRRIFRAVLDRDLTRVAPAPSCGGGTGWGVAPVSNRQLFASWPQFEQPCMDRVQDTVEIAKHFVVCEA